MSPAGLGSIDGTGRYTSPASISLQQSVIVSATSVADSSKIASATVVLYPVPPAEGRSLNGNVSYSYDPLGRLSSASSASGHTVEYHYDPVGNILSIARMASSQMAVLSFAPPSGSAGDPVTFSGVGLDAVTSVSFNGTAAQILSATNFSLVVQVRHGAASDVIKLIGPAGTLAFPFTVRSSQ